jgi:serine/threonine-protein kinase
MGLVVVAQHPVLGQRVAIKLLLPHAMSSVELVTRFVREAQAVAGLRSDHVAHVIDVGTQDAGGPFMVMEYLEGQDLAQLLAENERLSVTEAVDFVLQALDAVAEAHAKGVVHRDLKPSNLFLTMDTDGFPLIKVLDFGISKPVASDGVGDALTSTGAVMGSPIYMSPEQVRSSKSIDVRSDIWSLGVILYELLTGHPPFLGQTLGEVFAAILEAQPVPIGQLVEGVPGDLDRLILMCLQRDVERRIPDAGVLASALAPFASLRIRPIAARVQHAIVHGSPASQPASARIGITTVRGPPSKVRGTLIQWGQTSIAPVAKRPRRSVAVAGMGVAILFGATGWWLGNHPAAAAHPRSATQAVTVEISSNVVAESEPAGSNEIRAVSAPPSSPAPSASSAGEIARTSVLPMIATARFMGPVVRGTASKPIEKPSALELDRRD